MEYYKNRMVSSSKHIHKFSHLLIIVLSLCAFIPASVNAATSISQYGITWTFNANYTTGQFVNGDYWVVGPVTITSISPATTTSGRIMNGSMLNPAMGETQGYDSSIQYSNYNAALNVARTMPLTIQAGNSLVSTISLASPFPGGAKYALKTAAVLTIMASAPPAGTFRPSYYYGADKTAKYNWSTVQANMPLLKNLNPQIDLTQASTGQYYTWPGNLASFIPTIQRVWLDHRADWSNEYLAPQDNMSDYGSIMADQLGWASLVLNCQLPAGWVKDELLKHFVQKGIDWSGAIQHQSAGNNGWTPDGGHSIGRKWPTMFAAIMLNDTTLLNYIKTKSGDYCKAPYSTGNGFSTNVSTPSDAVSFAEDGQTFLVSAVDISKNRSGLTNYLSSDLNLPEYGMYHSVMPETDDRSWTSNHRQVNSGTVYSAFALSALIMGQRANWNHDAFFDYTDRFSEVCLAVAPNNAYPWKAHETAIALNMWKAYRKTYTPYWTRSNPTAVPVPDMTNASDAAYLNGSRVGTAPPPGTNYTVTASVSGGNGTISPSGSLSITSGSSQTFTAAPSTGYTVDVWKVDGNLVQTGGTTYTLGNITGTHGVTVQFKSSSGTTYTVTASVSGGNGTISPSGSLSMPSGSSQLFTAAPSSGYTVDVWMVDGHTVQTGGTSYTLSNIIGIHGVTVQFKSLSGTTYTVTSTVSGSNGTISPSGSLSVTSGSSQTFTAVPSTGYTVDVWKLDGTTVQTGGTTYTLSNITSIHGVTVQFKLLPSIGPVGYWKFDETSGTTAADSSGRNNTGTLLSSATFVNTGKFGGAVDLNSAATDAVEIGLNNCSPNAGTIAMWVFPQDFTTAPQYLFGHATSPWANRIQLYIADSAGNLALGMGSSHSTNTNIQALALQTWNHVALTWDGTNYVVYVNGVAKATGAYSGLSALNSFAHIGNDGYTTATNEAFVGRADETRLYNRALSVAEVQTLYTGSSAGNTAPVFNAISSQSVIIGASCTFTVSANDAEGDPITYSVSNLPAGAAFNASTRTFNWMPLSTQVGTYTVTFAASDGKLTTLKNVTISVSAQTGNVNDTLVLDMTFNDTPSDGVSDCSPFGNDGSSPASGMPTLVPGKFYNGYSFDGLADYVTIPGSPSLDVNNVTLAAWINPNAYVARQRIICKEIGTGAPSTVYALRFNEADPTKIEFWFTVGPVEYTVTSKTSIPLNQWTHIAATYNGSTAILYVNGKLDTVELDIPGMIINNANPVYIGSSQFAPDFFHGIIDEVLIYNEALSAAEVQALLLPANAPPILASIGDKTVNEGQNFSFIVSATDPDGNSLTYSAADLPAGATFTPATRTFSWTPTYSQAGAYEVTFTASDGSLTDEKVVNITVGDVINIGFKDDFTATTLNTSVWTFINPLKDSSRGLVSGLLKISFPSSKIHDISSTGNLLPRIMMPITNTDFQIATKFTSEMQKYQLQGLLIQQDSMNLIRYDVWATGTTTQWYLESWVDGVCTTTLSKNITLKAPYFLRITRAGSVWRFYYSADGANWIAAASLSRSMTTTSAGVYAGNCGTPGATFTTSVDFVSKK